MIDRARLEAEIMADVAVLAGAPLSDADEKAVVQLTCAITELIWGSKPQVAVGALATSLVLYVEAAATPIFSRELAVLTAIAMIEQLAADEWDGET